MAGRSAGGASGDRRDDICAGAWAVTRTDGEVLGFTDHDCRLSFDGMVFRADTGLTAQALAADAPACRWTIPRPWAR